MSTAIDYETKRQLSDIQSKIASLDARARRDGRAALDRPGGLLARVAVCAAAGFVQSRADEDIAHQLFPADRDLANLITRAAVSPAHSATATWATELIQTITQDVGDRLIPASAFVQLRALGIPYELGNGLIKVPTWAPTASGGFIVEGGPIPVAAFVFGAQTLAGKKAASIVAVDDELLLGAALDVELTLRTILSESIGLMIDGVLLSSAAATAAAPAGLLNGVSPLTATAGGGTNALLGDIKQLTAAIAPALRPVLITGPVQAASLTLLAQNPQGWPVIVAPTLAAGTVVAIDGAAFASALGVPSFRASQHATLHMDTVPTALSATGSPNTVAAPMRSSFQTDTTALRSIIPCDWALRRTGAVAYLTGATW